MSEKMTAYRNATGELPSQYQAWQIFGAGFENIGKDGKPVTLDLREPNENEVLLRVDALGLCLSDIKIINQGSAHPRLRGRDLATDPTVLGHECAATVVKAGKNWEDKFKPGQRYIVQADIYYKGDNFAFGYLIPGGLAKYAYVDERVLEGDEGCYLLPVKPETGYSQAALSEPWACVEMSYNVQERIVPGPGERMLFVGDDLPIAYQEQFANAAFVPRDLKGLPSGDFDDIVVEWPTPNMVETLVPKLADGGNLYLLGDPAEQGAVALDVGRVHYKGVRIYGGGPDLESIQKANERRELMAQGAALFIGAGGPMGQMHVQRAIEIPCGAKTVVVTDLDRARLDHIEKRFKGIAEAKGVELHLLAPTDFESQEEMNERIRELSPTGYTDVCVLAPVPALVTQATYFASDMGLVNIFAGIPVGNNASLELNDLCRGVTLIGTSGSRISDLQKILNMVEGGELNTNLSVAAIGGLDVAREGLEGVKEGRFPGKTVIYTQIPELELMALEDIPAKLPEIAEKLGPDGSWTKEAEEALLEMYAQ